MIIENDAIWYHACWQERYANDYFLGLRIKDPQERKSNPWYSYSKVQN